MEVTVEGGVEGDWALGERPNLEAQVTLMNIRVVDLIRHDGVA